MKKITHPPLKYSPGLTDAFNSLFTDDQRQLFHSLGVDFLIGHGRWKHIDIYCHWLKRDGTAIAFAETLKIDDPVSPAGATMALQMFHRVVRELFSELGDKSTPASQTSVAASPGSPHPDDATATAQ